jgi:Tfp pilus assembly PilM family ATPase
MGKTLMGKTLMGKTPMGKTLMSRTRTSTTLGSGTPMRLAQRKLGWIGVDVGTSSLKIVQVARGKQGWRIAASAVVPRQRSWEANASAVREAISSLDEIKAARSLQEGYRGRSVAATLPMALCDVHRLDRTLDQESNAGAILRQTIETATQQSAEQVQCDYWSAPAVAGKPGWTQALTVPRSWTERLCEDIAEAGWSCEAIDGLPMAIVRAVGLVEDASVPVAALDWGHSRATLCLIDNGQPSYVRCLKDCGLRNVLAALVDELHVTELEAQRLLEACGLSALSSEASPAATAEKTSGSHPEIAQLVQEIIAEPVSQLVEEIKRSC